MSPIAKRLLISVLAATVEASVAKLSTFSTLYADWLGLSTRNKISVNFVIPNTIKTVARTEAIILFISKPLINLITNNYI